MKLVYNNAVKISELNKINDLASYVTTATIFEPEEKWIIEAKNGCKEVESVYVQSSECMPKRPCK